MLGSNEIRMNTEYRSRLTEYCATNKEQLGASTQMHPGEYFLVLVFVTKVCKTSHGLEMIGIRETFVQEKVIEKRCITWVEMLWEMQIRYGVQVVIMMLA